VLCGVTVSSSNNGTSARRRYSKAVGTSRNLPKPTFPVIFALRSASARALKERTRVPCLTRTVIRSPPASHHIRIRVPPEAHLAL
jgi:hypothetical protein